MALHCCINLVVNRNGHEVPLSSRRRYFGKPHTAAAPSRQATLMLRIQGSASQFTGLIVLDCAPVQAECVALFSASATENRLKHLDGFTGAAFFASVCGRFVLEYVVWKDPAALAAARENPLFSEHVKIVEHHCSLRHVSFSSISNTVGIDAIRFERGDRFSMLMYKCSAAESVPKTLDRLRSVSELARVHSLLQMAEDGSNLVLLSREAIDTSAAPALRAMFAEPAFHNEFTVVESIAAPSIGEKFAPLYNLALVPEQSPGRQQFKEGRTHV
jgi:hypothetical protein